MSLLPENMELSNGSSEPNENKMYVVFQCKDGHTTPVYPFPADTKKIVHKGRCAFAVPHVAKERMDWGFAEVDKPVAVWFAGGNGKLPWMSMLRACDQPFVGFEVVPQAAKDFQVVFPDSEEKQAVANGQHDDKGDVML